MTQQVTVFGGSGFVGTQVVRALAKAGWRIRVAVRSPNFAGRLRPMGDVGQIQIVRADIRKPAEVAAAVAGSNAVVNLVGLLNQTLTQDFDAFQHIGAKTVAEAAKAAGATQLLHMSAIGANADSKSLYARSKGLGEQAVRAAFPGAVILRPSVVFGPEDNFFNLFAKLAGVAPILPLVGGGKTKFQPVYVGDVASAVVAALKNPASAGHTYELGGPEVVTFKEILQTVGAEAHRQRPLLPLPFFVAAVIGLVGDLQSKFSPFPALLTTDQVLLLRHDNVVSEGAEGLRALGIAPTSMDSILPTYLWLYREGGEFAHEEYGA